MKSESAISIRNSISTRLLRIVFSLYLVIAIGVTLTHMVMEYQYQKKNIGHDLVNLQKTFEQGLAVEIWHLNHEELQSTLKGMLEIPAIVGVRIQNESGKSIAIGGIIASGSDIGDVGQHVNLLGLDKEESEFHNIESLTFELFKHEFPILYTYKEETKTLGRATIYSSTSEVFRRVKLGFSLLVVNAFIKTAALWFIFLWFSSVLLRKPLAALTAAANNVSLENLDSFKVDIKTSGRNELKILEESFNSMIGNLHQSIVDRQSSDTKLIESEQKFRAVFNQTFQFIGLLDTSGTLLEANQSALQTWGLKESDVINRPFWETPWWSHSPELQMTLRKAVKDAAQGEFVRFEARHIGPDGSPLYADFSLKPVADAAGKIVMLIPEGRDITERKHFEAALEKSEEKFSKAFRSGPSLISISTVKEGRFIDINESFAKTTGYSREEVLGKTSKEINLWADSLERARVIAEIKEHGFINNHEVRVRKKSGDIITTLWSADVIEVEGEDCIIVVAHDITDRKQADDKLNESENKYRTLFEKSADAVLIIEGDKFVDCNPATVKMLGYTNKNELLKTHPSQLSPETQPDGRISFEKANEMMSIAFNQGSHRFEWDHKRSNGEVFPVEVLLTAIPIGERQLLHVVWRDITERKKMEEELLRAQKLESIGVLAGGIAHDFNNLLTAIMNNLFLMKNQINPDERVNDRIKAAERAAVRAQGLTQQLLTFSKGGEPVKGLIDIRELVNESISIALRGSNVSCENLIPSDICHIEADAGQMNQAINNIIINADQAMPEGGTIRINCENVIVGAENNLTLKEGNYIKISIGDQGTGISDEHLSRIFDPYFTTKQKGSGLGLSTTYSIIKKHGGHINIESELGVGTVFHIYLPASMEKVPVKKPAEDSSVTGTGKVLVMDDDELVRDSLGQMLTYIGYVVEFAYDGKEAIDIYKNAMASEYPFDAVIMDLTVPGGMGGKEAIKELAKIDPNVKAIVSSGYSYDPIMSNYRDYGFRAVLMKPYQDIGDLSRILNDVIEGK